jgi:hypothetical protein
MSAQRYSRSYGDMEENHSGDWVKSDDYDTLERSLRESWASEKRLAARIAQLEASLTNDQCQRVISDLAAREWSGLTGDDIRMFDKLIFDARSTSETFAEYDGPLPDAWKVEPKPNGGATSWHRARWVNGVLKCWECPAEWTPPSALNRGVK